MPNPNLPKLRKCATGIVGFDEISGGGLPYGRPTLLAGYAGSGKTLFALQFILHGVEQYQESGVFVSFEENANDIAVNVGSLGFDIAKHQSERRLEFIHININPHEMVEAGEYDLDGLFLRLGAAIDATGATRIVLDAVENLFSAFNDLRILRGEFRRLLEWLKQRQVTAIITTERGTDTLTRHGLEEYIADCVVALDNRVDNQLATRRLRIVKYRGSAHGSDEYPFVLNQQGFTVMPVTSARMNYSASSECISSGIPELDDMLMGGYYRGSAILVSGTSGTGKSSIAAYTAHTACARGEHCLYLALEESPDQIVRNMASIGLNLSRWLDSGQLQFHAARAASASLECHLAELASKIDKFHPDLVVIDPVTAYNLASQDPRIHNLMIQIVDMLKARGITSLFTALTRDGDAPESTVISISSLVDDWLLLRNLESAGERTRGLYICKARGKAHSNQIREFVLGDDGIKLVDVLLDAQGKILTGSARDLYLRLEADAASMRNADADRRRAILEDRRRILEAKIDALRSEYEDELHALESEIDRDQSHTQRSTRTLTEVAARRNMSVTPHN